MAATAVRKAPYKDFLQPALHRRFSSTATVLLAVSYLEALVLTQWSSLFWSWFPLGPAGFRTALIFACGLAILILRIAQYHVGLRTTGSGWQLLRTSLTSFHAYETAFWYGLSSLVFSHVFLWSMPEKSNLGWVTPFSGDRVRLNERPLFLVCYMVTCALAQTISHYKEDVDRLDMGKTKTASGADQQAKGTLSGSLGGVLAQLPGVLAGCVFQALIALFAAFFLYYVVLRSTLWSWTLMFMRPFYNMPKTSILPPSGPGDVYLIARCFVAGMLLSFIWASGNTAFSAFMVKAPLKNGKPLTSESKDPNGSLLSGLKSKKLPIKCFAMWELALIAENFEVRRQAIYDDIDRKDGPMWSQVYAICMDVIKDIEIRVDNYGKPLAPAPAQPAVEGPKHRFGAAPRDEPISNSRGSARGGVEKALEYVATSPGSTPASKISPIVKKQWKDAKDRLLTKEQQEAMTPEHVKGQFELLAVQLLNMDYIGPLFRHDFRTRFTATVLGEPYVESTLYTNAVSAICRLAVQSLKEDKYGNVHRDVASIVRTLTAIIKKVEDLKLRYPAHWTDVTGLRETPEVDEVLDSMRSGLGQVLAGFEMYTSDLRLTMTDVRSAKEAMARPRTEVVEKPKEKASAEVKETTRASRRSRSHRHPEMEEVR